jgi:uncharacterized protein
MDQKQILLVVEALVRTELKSESTGHDWWHIYRVWTLAKKIAAHEGGDLFIIELTALLHDIADWKFHNYDEAAGPTRAREILTGLQLNERIILPVCSAISQISFKGALVKEPDQMSLEAKIVQDADRLDAIGAIGIARTFAYGGAKGRLLYDPEMEPVMHTNAEEYARSQSPTINHFYEKLLLLKDRMNTPYARSLAENRHVHMQKFLNEFFQEWDGEA